MENVDILLDSVIYVKHKRITQSRRRQGGTGGMETETRWHWWNGEVDFTTLPLQVNFQTLGA